MNLKLRSQASQGLQEQIKAQIRVLIQTGELSPGQALPSARDLALLLKVNRNTVWASYRDLAAEGWLKSKVGAGTFVSTDRPQGKAASLQGIVDQALDRAESLGIASETAANFFLDYLSSRHLRIRGRRVLVVECNQPTGQMIARTLRSELGVEVRQALIQDLEKSSPDLETALKGVDLVVCGLNHLAELEELPAWAGAEVVPVMLSPDIALIKELRRLPPGSRVGFTCVNQRSSRALYSHQLFASGSSLQRLIVGADQTEALRRLVADCQVIFASFAVYEKVLALAGPDKRVIDVKLFLEPSGLALVREALQRQVRSKL